jgi:hypothetical protein
MSSIRHDLEQKLAILNSEKFKLVSYKETYPYVLKETLKFLTKKTSRLQHSLKQLTEEEAQQVRDTFKDVGIELNF